MCLIEKDIAQLSDTCGLRFVKKREFIDVVKSSRHVDSTIAMLRMDKQQCVDIYNPFLDVSIRLEKISYSKVLSRRFSTGNLAYIISGLYYCSECVDNSTWDNLILGDILTIYRYYTGKPKYLVATMKNNKWRVSHVSGTELITIEVKGDTLRFRNKVVDMCEELDLTDRNILYKLKNLLQYRVKDISRLCTALGVE